VPEVHGLSSKNHSGMIWPQRRRWNKVLLAEFDEADIFRIDHYSAAGSKQPVGFPVRQYFRGVLLEPYLHPERGNHYGRGLRRTGPRRFLRSDGHIRDRCIQNHLFQVLSNLAMEPSVRLTASLFATRTWKVLKAIAPIEEEQLGTLASSVATG